MRPESVQGIHPMRAFNVPPQIQVISEDCLYLNIWTPSTARVGGTKLPVMVYIHGGGFRSGSPNDLEISGVEMAKKGVIYIGVAYRLGVFGFMAHPEATRESGHDASGNWGILDQITALQWVKRNIGAFGGDSANVTIMGESAGSESVFTLQCSPLAHGLFAKASGWSGANLPPGGLPPRSLADAEVDGVKVQQAMNAGSLAEMRAMGWDSVLAAMNQVGDLLMRPIVDGYSLPDLPENIFESGKQNDVPILVSSTAHDAGTSSQFFQVKTLADLKKAVHEHFGDFADQFFKLLPASNDSEAIKQAQMVVANNGFGVANRDWARAQALSGKQPAYLVQFARAVTYRDDLRWIGTPPPYGGASHAGDISYWLGTYKNNNPGCVRRAWFDWDLELSDNMQNVLIAFARTGNPSSNAVRVPRYDPNNEQRVVFGDTIWIEKMNTEQIEFLRSHPTARQ
jgi:para-nitrobenzyl esterase